MPLGKNDGETIFLSPPSWDCGWYWGFGYIGNINRHYHIDGLSKGKNIHDGMIEHFGDSLRIRPSDVWTFAELMQTFYNLKEAAEVLGRGGSYSTTNPCASVIMNKEETARINNDVFPAIFDEIYKILERNANNESLFSKLVSLNIKGDTGKVVKFMKENNINTDDLKSIVGISQHDYSGIHSYYWKEYHANKAVKA